MLRIIAIFATQNHRTWNLRMAELSMGAFTSRSLKEPRSLKIGNEVANFARHVANVANYMV